MLSTPSDRALTTPMQVQPQTGRVLGNSVHGSRVYVVLSLFRLTSAHDSLKPSKCWHLLDCLTLTRRKECDALRHVLNVSSFVSWGRSFDQISALIFLGLSYREVRAVDRRTAKCTYRIGYDVLVFHSVTLTYSRRRCSSDPSKHSLLRHLDTATHKAQRAAAA